MTNARSAPPKKPGRGRPRAPAVAILVRVPVAELAVLDAWIAQQPRPAPSRPVALRRLAAIGRRSPAASPLSRPALPTRPAGVDAPGLVWTWGTGQLVVANWQAQRRYVLLGCPTRRARLWTGTAPTDADWRKIAAACERLQREMKEWGARW